MTTEERYAAIEQQLAALRADVDLRHSQNRATIQALRKKMDELVEENRGTIQAIRKKMDDIVDGIGDLRVVQARNEGEKTISRMVVPIIGSLIVGILLLIGQHLWR